MKARAGGSNQDYSSRRETTISSTAKSSSSDMTDVRSVHDMPHVLAASEASKATKPGEESQKKVYGITPELATPTVQSDDVTDKDSPPVRVEGLRPKVMKHFNFSEKVKKYVSHEWENEKALIHFFQRLYAELTEKDGTPVAMRYLVLDKSAAY
ncbi:hypothetical protein BT69DRAFT_1060347 [Atractiella rhizophila]|nr:hypothetical protein BT69DRAFT_1060347 [Atractiella rhizophila]